MRRPETPGCRDNRIRLRYSVFACCMAPVLPNVAAGVYAIILTQTLDGFVQNAVLPSLPYYAMQDMDANAWDISLFGSAMCVAQMLLCPFLGRLSDRIGRKKVLLSALAAQAAFNFYQSTCATVIQLVIARALVGLAMSGGPVEMAYILDYVDGDEGLNPVLAIQKIMCSFGSLAGPFLAQFFTPDQFPRLCYLLVAVNGINFIIGWFFWEDYTPEPETVEEKDNIGFKKPLLESDEIIKEEETSAADEISTDDGCEDGWKFLNSTTIMLLFISILNSTAFQVSDVNSAIYFKNYFYFDQTLQCKYMMVLQASTLLWTPLIPFLISKFGEEAICIFSAIGSAAIVFNLVLLQGVWWVPFMNAFLLVGLFGTAIGFGYLNILQKKLSRDYLGAFFGLSNSMQSIGGTIAPLMGGAIYGYSNIAPYFVSSVMFILVGVLYWILTKFRPDVDEEEYEEEEELVAPLKPGSMTRPMSMQTMSYSTSNNLAVNLLSVDVSLYAEAYAAHQRQTWRERRKPGMPTMSTAPCLVNVKSRSGSSGMLRTASGNSLKKPPKRVFSIEDLRNMGKHASDGELQRIGSRKHRFSTSS